jgi:3-oxoacyl-[acyl-carrier protein] reductase
MSYEPLSSLEGQTAVVIGATGGFGGAIAQRLASRGARVIGVARTVTKSSITILPADVTDPAQVAKMVTAVRQCDIVVNASGVTKFIPHSRVDLLDEEFFDLMMQSHVRAVYTLIKNFMPLLKQSNNGIFVNIGSNTHHAGSGSNLAYGSAKVAAEQLVKNFSRFMYPARIISVNPGAVDTGFVANAPLDFYNYRQDNSLHRPATVDDVAVAVETYVMNMRYATGITVNVDGGRSI